MPLRNLLTILTMPRMLFTTSMRNIQGNHSHRTISTSSLRLTEVCHMKEEGNVTVLAQLHTWHESHTLLESSVHIVSLFAMVIAVA